MDYFSKKYNKLYRCDEKNQHHEMKNLWQFGKFWWRKDKDVLIHESFLGEYIESCKKSSKKYKRKGWCEKRGIEFKEE